MPRSEFDRVEKLLRMSFGKPSHGPSATADSGKLGGYRLTPEGGSIQFGHGACGTQVIVLRKLTQREIDDALIEAAGAFRRGK